MTILKSLVSNMHYYQFNIGDYRKDTVHLTPIEHYIYRTLIDWYYLDENPIPLETQSVIRRLSLGLDNEQNLINVLSDFFKKDVDGWHHVRIDSEIITYHANVLKNKVNGKLGGRPKKTQSVILGNPSKSQINPNQEPITNNHKPIKYTPPIPAELLAEWLAVRKKKPVTERVFIDIEKQAGLLVWSAEQAIIKCCEQGWIGFDASWVDKPQKKSYQDERASVSNAAFGNLLNKYSIEEKEITSD
jgi:uncharacterized protein YdaU (DUF1376 family)